MYKHHPIKVINADNSDILKQVEYYKDKNNQSYAKMEALVISKEEAIKRADGLAKELRLKPKQIKGVDKYYYLHDTTFTSLPVKDTIYLGDTAYSVRKIDGWVDISAIAGKRGGEIHFSSKDTLTRIDVIKNPLFGSVKRSTIIRNTSPYNKIQQGYSWTVKEKKDILTIGPYIGWDFINKSPAVGISIQLPIIHFRK